MWRRQIWGCHGEDDNGDHTSEDDVKSEGVMVIQDLDKFPTEAQMDIWGILQKCIIVLDGQVQRQVQRLKTIWVIILAYDRRLVRLMTKSVVKACESVIQLLYCEMLLVDQWTIGWLQSLWGIFINLENPLVLPLTRCAHAHTLHWSDVQQANRTYTKAHTTLIGVTTFVLLFFTPCRGSLGTGRDSVYGHIIY